MSIAEQTKERRYRQELEKRARLPEGFLVGSDSIEFTAPEVNRSMRLDMSLITAAAPASPAAAPTTAPRPPQAGMGYAAMTTANRIASPSVRELRQRRNRGHLHAVLINNRISNVGRDMCDTDYQKLTAALAAHLNTPARDVLSLSTGIIGWQLPVPEMITALPKIHTALQPTTALGLADSILTTDRYAKIRDRTIPIPPASGRTAATGRITGICKGAGMVEPSLATTFAFFLTDIDWSNAELHSMLRPAIAESFNALSIDGDQSTSDVALVLTTRRRPAPRAGKPRRDLYRRCAAALRDVACELAEDLVRGGEGVSHLVRVDVRGTRSRRQAVELGRYILQSRLCATAIAGNDPNSGRFAARVGSFQSPAPLDLRAMTIHLGSTLLYGNQTIHANPRIEKEAAAYLRARQWDPLGAGAYPSQTPAVDLIIDFHRGPGRATVLGGDLTSEYVHINGDYRT